MKISYLFLTMLLSLGVGANSVKKLFKKEKPIIGVIYLDPLIGYEKHPGMDKVIENALQQMKLLESEGVDGVLVENDNDTPHTLKAKPEIIAAMSVILKRLVKEAKDIVVGVEFLIHDPIASLAIAKASGAKFIRTDYFVDKMSRAKFGGMIPIDAKKYMDYRKSIGAEDVVVFTDLQVKYAKLEEVGKTFDQSAKQAKDANSDGLIVTGKKSGFPPNVGNLTETRKGKTDLPIIVGSGFSPTNAEELLKFADAAIVGTSMMTDGVLQKDKIQKLMAVVKKVRREL